MFLNDESWSWLHRRTSSASKLPLKVDLQKFRKRKLSDDDVKVHSKVFNFPKHKVFKWILATVSLFSIVQISLMFLTVTENAIDTHKNFEDLNSMLTTTVHEAVPRVEYYVHGHGRGHASRSKTIIASLVERGYFVCVFANPKAATLLEGVGSETHYVPTMPSKADYSSASLVWNTIYTVYQRLRVDFDSSRCGRDVRGPDFIVTDGDLPGLWRGQRHGVPVITVGHGYVFSTTPRPAYASAEAWETQNRLNGMASSVSSCTVAVSFVPLKPYDETTVIAKPSLRPALAGVDAHRKRRKLIVAYFRDPAKAEQAIQYLSNTDYEIRVFGIAEGSVSGVDSYGFSEAAFISSLREASAVVGSSGANLISECMYLHVPMLALYNADDTEQRLNAAMLQQTGKGMGVSFDDLNQEVLDEFLKGMSSMQTQDLAWTGLSAVEATTQCIHRVYGPAQQWESLSESSSGWDSAQHRRMALSVRQI